MSHNIKNNFSRAHLGDIPQYPGVYIFRDLFGKVIYIGKAANLRKRVSQYFQPSRKTILDPKLRSLINSIDSYDFIVVKTETEALLLESKLIKDYTPYYNTLLKDDKRFLMIKLNLKEPFPHPTLTRLRKNDGSLYFGPFPRAGAVRQTSEYLSAHFKLRLCNSLNPGPKERKYCMEARVKKCSEPCIGKITMQEYSSRVYNFIAILEGKSKEIIEELKAQMEKSVKALNFEKAGLLRDIKENIEFLWGIKVRNFKNTTIQNSNFTEKSLTSLKKILGFKNDFERIDAVDISNLSDNFAVASVVSFKKGVPDKKNYRRFKIKTVSGINDFAMIKEVVYRRYKEKDHKITLLPDLLVVDGGKGQLSSAILALVELDVKAIPIIGLAKKNEEIFIPGKDSPIVLEKTDPALKLIMAIRDEAHRFAITYNRNIRLKRISESILDDIPGVGKKRKQQLLKSFPSINSIRNSTPEEISSKASINITQAKKILEFLS